MPKVWPLEVLIFKVKTFEFSERVGLLRVFMESVQRVVESTIEHFQPVKSVQEVFGSENKLENYIVWEFMFFVPEYWFTVKRVVAKLTALKWQGSEQQLLKSGESSYLVTRLLLSAIAKILGCSLEEHFTAKLHYDVGLVLVPQFWTKTDPESVTINP